MPSLPRVFSPGASHRPARPSPLRRAGKVTSGSDVVAARQAHPEFDKPLPARLRIVKAQGEEQLLSYQHGDSPPSGRLKKRDTVGSVGSLHEYGTREGEGDIYASASSTMSSSPSPSLLELIAAPVMQVRHEAEDSADGGGVLFTAEIGGDNDYHETLRFSDSDGDGDGDGDGDSDSDMGEAGDRGGGGMARGSSGGFAGHLTDAELTDAERRFVAEYERECAAFWSPFRVHLGEAVASLLDQEPRPRTLLEAWHAFCAMVPGFNVGGSGSGGGGGGDKLTCSELGGADGGGGGAVGGGGRDVEGGDEQGDEEGGTGGSGGTTTTDDVDEGGDGRTRNRSSSRIRTNRQKRGDGPVRRKSTKKKIDWAPTPAHDKDKDKDKDSRGGTKFGFEDYGVPPPPTGSSDDSSATKQDRRWSIGRASSRDQEKQGRDDKIVVVLTLVSWRMSVNLPR